MKKIIIKVISCLCVALVSLSVMAAEVSHEGKITRIYADDNGIVYIQLDVTDFNGCETVKNNHYYLLKEGDGGHPRFEELYALVLAAAHNQNQILIRVDETTCNGADLVNSPIARITQNF